MKKLKYLGNEPTKVRVPGKKEKVDMVKNQIISFNDDLANSYLKSYSEYFVEVDENYIKKNLYWIIPSIIAVIIPFIGWIFFSNSSNGGNKQIINSGSQNNTLQTNSGNISQNISSGNINIQNNDGQIAIGDNNNLVQNKLPTEIEEKQTKQWEECETTLRALFRILNRNDFESSFALFDEHLRKEKYFSIKNMEKFKNKFVKGDLEIWELNKKFIDDSTLISRCEFTFRLRYININDGKEKMELWKGVVLKDKDKVNYFQIGELKCLDKNCESNPLFD